MSCSKCSRIEEAIECLDVALERVERQAEEIRWRIDNFPDDLPTLDDQIAGLSSDIGRIAVLYGHLSAQVEAREHVEPPCEGCGGESGNLCDC